MKNYNQKKLFALIIAILLTLLMLAACNNDESGDKTTDTTSDIENSETTETDVIDIETTETTTTETETESVLEEDCIAFSTLQVNETEVYGKVPNSQTNFSFLNEVTVSGSATYIVSLDIYGMQTVTTKTVPLEIGDNTFYILESVGENLKLYTVTIRRRPMYTVNFNTDSDTIVNFQTVEEDSFATAPEAPEKIGHTFNGWEYDFESPILGNTIINALWTPNSYTVAYDVNGGSMETDSQSFVYGTEYELSTPNMVGFTFVGWYSENTKISNVGLWNIAEDLTLTAKWSANTNTPYTVEHYIEKLDGTYELKNTENKTGTTNTEVTPSTRNYAGFTPPAKQTVTVLPDGTQKVQYYYTRNSYIITFVSNGGEPVSSVTLKYEETIPGITTRTGFTFGGWFKDVNLSNSISTVPSQNTTVYAYWQEENKPSDFTYTGTTSITITGYKNSIESVRIPTYIGGLEITSIAASAFKNCSTLKNIIIPNCVTSIGASAFKGCSSLESITLPFVGANKDGTSNTHFGYIFGASSYSDNSEYIPESFKTVVITGGTIIGYSAFRDCSSLTSIFIPDSVTSIWLYAFEGCKSLTSITVDEGSTNYKSIDGNLYSKDGDTLIQYAIGKTDTIFTIPDSVTSIGNYAFLGCSSLASVTIPDSVTSIGYHAFSGCSSLASVTIPDSVTSIGYYAFSGCSSLASVTIPDSVTSIGDHAFLYCSNLESITLPFVGANKGGTSKTHFGYIFGASSYSYNSGYVPASLKTVVITGGTSIDDLAFAYCSSLTSITIPDSITSIGDESFYGCSSLETVYYTGSREEWAAISTSSFGNSYLINANIIYNYVPEE